MNSTKQVVATSQDTSKEEEIETTPLAIGLPVFILVVLGLCYGVYWIHGYLQDEQKLPVQKIVFSGDFTMLNERQLEQRIRHELTSSFFALDVNEVHELMESQSWVFSASIRKRWPSQLFIHIEEQTPVAIWNDDLLLNQFGETFDGLTSFMGDNISPIKKAELSSKLVQLYGPGGSEKTALAGYNNMQRLLNASGQVIQQLVLSERFAWQSKLNNGVILKLGRREYINRLQRYIDVYPMLVERNAEIDYVDLRYDTGLAVGFKSDKQPLKTRENT